jgi:hypothetical protein
VKALRIQVMLDVGDLAYREVIEDSYLMLLLHQGIDQIGANEASATCDEYSHKRYSGRNPI